MIEALCDFGSHLLKAYVFKSFDLLSLCDFGPHLLEACVFESFDFVYSPVTCFDGRRENWALGVWSSPVMIVWMIWIALMVGGKTGPLEFGAHQS